MWETTKTVPSIRKVVQFSGEPKRPGVIGWKEFMALGEEDDDDALVRDFLQFPAFCSNFIKKESHRMVAKCSKSWLLLIQL